MLSVGHGIGSLMPFSLHAPRHIGMEEVGWWGDPRRWDYRHASMRRQAWRRLGGGETPGGGITVVPGTLGVVIIFSKRRTCTRGYMIPTQEHQSKPTWQTVTSLGYICDILQILLSPSALTPMPGTGQPSFRH